MNAIGIEPRHATFDLSDAKLIAAGHPERSALFSWVTRRGPEFLHDRGHGLHRGLLGGSESGDSYFDRIVRVEGVTALRQHDLRSERWRDKCRQQQSTADEDRQTVGFRESHRPLKTKWMPIPGGSWKRTRWDPHEWQNGLQAE